MLKQIAFAIFAFSCLGTHNRQRHNPEIETETVDQLPWHFHEQSSCCSKQYTADNIASHPRPFSCPITNERPDGQREADDTQLREESHQQTMNFHD